jgi:hypothetical protein
MPCSRALFGLEASKLHLEGPLWSLDYIGGFTSLETTVLLHCSILIFSVVEYKGSC